MNRKLNFKLQIQRFYLDFNTFFTLTYFYSNYYSFTIRFRYKRDYNFFRNFSDNFYTLMFFVCMRVPTTV